MLALGRGTLLMELPQETTNEILQEMEPPGNAKHEVTRNFSEFKE